MYKIVNDNNQYYNNEFDCFDSVGQSYHSIKIAKFMLRVLKKRYKNIKIIVNIESNLC